MTEVLAVFRSRAQATDCNMRMRASGIPCALVNTPREAQIGCGLSVKFAQNYFMRAGRFIKGAGYSAFFGFLVADNRYGRTVYKRI